MIIRQKRRRTFTVVDNKALRDPGLSFKATGLLAFLLSLPEEWQPNSRHLAGIKTDGRESVMSGLRELEQAGYLHRSRTALPNGTFEWVIEVYETPMAMVGKPVHGTTEIGAPWSDEPSTVEPSTENPTNEETLRLLTDEGETKPRAQRVFVKPPMDDLRAQLRPKRPA